MAAPSRREFLRGMESFGIVSVSGIVTSGIASANESNITGRVLSHTGEPVANSRVQNYGGDSFIVQTDSGGDFQAKAEVRSRLDLCLYRVNENGQPYTERTNVPHVYSFGEFRAYEGGTDLGDIEMPEASLVRLRAIDSDGDPIRGANPRIEHDNVGFDNMFTGSDGWAYLDGAKSDGIELAGEVTISMDIPTDGSESQTYEIEERIDSAKVYEFQINDGITEVKNEDKTRTSTVTSSSPTTTAKGTNSPTSTNKRTTTISASQQTNITTQQESKNHRGFLTNNSKQDLGPLDNPFFLTVGGFALSVAGVIHNLVRGN